MNEHLSWLRRGDLTSNGAVDEVVRLVEHNPVLPDDLLQGLSVCDDVVRGHTADAVEKLARTQAREVLPFFDTILARAGRDPVPMVRWHLAMTLGHFSIYPAYQDVIVTALLAMLPDVSIFTRSWAIASFCLVARQ